jgi:hypothetical protein
MTKFSFKAHHVKNLEVLKDSVLVSDMQFKGRTLSSGIILLGDNAKSSGIRPRWAQVYLTGPEQQDVQPGDWILVVHGRWTRGVEIEDHDGVKTIRKIDPKDILLVSDEPQSDDTISDAING